MPKIKRSPVCSSNGSKSMVVSDRIYTTFVVASAFTVALIYRSHLAYVLERGRHFSHMSTLERELSFRSEMGLYYSYFKTVIEAPSFIGGLHSVMNDNLTEYPDTINTLNRFNLYPEVVLGILYRCYLRTMNQLKLPTAICWDVSRGNGLSEIRSCRGLGEPAYFYIEGAFLLNGIMMGAFFIFGVYLSGSILGGTLAVASFFFNHAECTRVQWTAPLRESFGYPFFVVQMLLVTVTMRSPRPRYDSSYVIALATVCFMLPWQFAQFALLTQTLSVFGVYLLRLIDSHKVKVIIAGQMAGSIVSTVLLFGNKMMISSFFVSCVMTVWAIVSLESAFEKLRFRLMTMVCQVGMLCCGTLVIKKITAILLNVTDDAHISDILRSKFTSFQNFHTMLYTCAREFDFLDVESVVRVSRTLLLPAAFVAVGAVVNKVLCREENAIIRSASDGASQSSESEKLKKSINSGRRTKMNGRRGAAESDAKRPSQRFTDDSKSEHLEQPPHGDHYRSKEHAELMYNTFQLLAFTVLAAIIMRLKIFWVPHMCLVTSLLTSSKVFGVWFKNVNHHYAFIAILLGAMSIQGFSNILNQWQNIGEYSDMPTEQLVEWINKTTKPDASFAGPMPLMANVKLSTGRPIVNHPHYEDAALRARTMKVYSLFSRKPDHEVWSNLNQLKANYAVIDQSYCRGLSGRGCSMASLWDVEDAANRGKVPACQRFYNHPEPYFRRVFRNDKYDVLELVDSRDITFSKTV